MFLCFGIPMLSMCVMDIMNVLRTGMNMYISHIHVWLCYSSHGLRDNLGNHCDCPSKIIALFSEKVSPDKILSMPFVFKFIKKDQNCTTFYVSFESCIGWVNKVHDSFEKRYNWNWIKKFENVNILVSSTKTFSTTVISTPTISLRLNAKVYK